MNQFKGIIFACLLILSKDCLAADPDHHFCDHTYYTQTFATTMLSSNEITAMFNGPSSSLVLSHSPLLSVGDSTSIGTFIDSDIYNVALPSFCQQINERLYTGDLNGDGQEDLICRKADGSFRVRLFHGQKSFGKEQKIESFKCLSPNSLQVGDFDGDKVADLLCTDYVSILKTSHIYFGSNCNSNNDGRRYMQAYKMSQHNKHRDMHRSGMNHAHFNSIHAKDHLEHLCQGIVFEHTLTPCEVGAVVGTGDLNNDGYDDIVCVNVINKFYYHLSTGKRGITFQTQTASPVAADTCDVSANIIKIVNIDSHPNEEVLCIPIDGISGITVFYYDYQNDLQAATTPPIPACSPFCPSVVGATLTAPDDYIVIHAGDFNGDGMADVMCRFKDGADIKTDIIYSHARP